MPTLWTLPTQVPNRVWAHMKTRHLCQFSSESNQRSDVATWSDMRKPEYKSAGAGFKELHERQVFTTHSQKPCPHRRPNCSNFGSLLHKMSQILRTQRVHRDQRVTLCSKMGSAVVQGRVQSTHTELLFPVWPLTRHTMGREKLFDSKLRRDRKT